MSKSSSFKCIHNISSGSWPRTTHSNLLNSSLEMLYACQEGKVDTWLALHSYPTYIITILRFLRRCKHVLKHLGVSYYKADTKLTIIMFSQILARKSAIFAWFQTWIMTPGAREKYSSVNLQKANKHFYFFLSIYINIYIMFCIFLYDKLLFR